MTNPMQQAVSELRDKINATTDPSELAALEISLASAVAAEAKFYPPGGER